MAGTSSRGVLIVEDDQELRSLFAVLLEMENFLVFQAENGMQGLQLLRDNSDTIVLLITDLGLPKIGGVDLISQARTLRPGLKILGASGMSGTHVRELVMQAGADDFISKPFEPREAVLKVRALLGEL
jgi:DNA-binding response OmpR family regulator